MTLGEEGISSQPSATILTAAPNSRPHRLVMLGAAAGLLCASILLLAQLGHYALWDDEADTALFAESILATGDTSAVMGHNIAAYGGGWALTNLHERYIPPLPYYLAAMSLGPLGRTAFAARLPFALCGIGVFATVIFWLIKDRADPWTCVLTYVALLSNVSLILYCRQCRYYALVILLSVLLAYVYVHWNRSWRTQSLLVLIFTGLLATSYIGFAAAAACIAADWIVWGRRSVRPGWPKGTITLAVQCVITLLFLRIYNPFHPNPNTVASDLSLKCLRLWWNVRDLSLNQFWILPILASIPFVWRYCTRDQWLLRGGAAVFVYFLVVSAVAPHGEIPFAEVRYFVGIIPLAVVLEARVIRAIAGRRGVLALIMGIPLLSTNILSGGIFATSLINSQAPQLTLALFIEELANPTADPFTATSSWLQRHVPNDATVLVLPQYAMYPLLFYAPQFVYAWQLTDPPAPQFRSLPNIHFAGRELPQYVVLFGSDGFQLALRDQYLQRVPPNQYALVQSLPVYSRVAYRPELFLHEFVGHQHDVAKDGIFVLKRQ